MISLSRICFLAASVIQNAKISNTFGVRAGILSRCACQSTECMHSHTCRGLCGETLHDTKTHRVNVFLSTGSFAEDYRDRHPTQRRCQSGCRKIEKQPQNLWLQLQLCTMSFVNQHVTGIYLFFAFLTSTQTLSASKWGFPTFSRSELKEGKWCLKFCTHCPPSSLAVFPL